MPTCPRCGRPVRRPDLMSSAWRCANCGPVAPLHVAAQVGPEVMSSVAAMLADGTEGGTPLWCPWPLPSGWLVTGVGWAGDDRRVQATVVACSGPSPLHGGPADLVVVAEEPGVGLGNHLADLPGTDPGLAGCAGSTAHARVRAGGRDTPLWSVGDATDRVAYVGEARGVWLYAIGFPPDAGYELSEHIELHDLAEWVPPELVYGAPSPYLPSSGSMSH